MKQIKNLSELLVDDLRNLYSAEKAQLTNIPTISQNVNSPELRTELRAQLDKKKNRIERLEHAFSILNHKPAEEKNQIVNQMFETGLNRVKNTAEHQASDAGIISTLQNVNHYGITNYGTACAYAKATGHEEVANILHKILVDEKSSDEHLSKISEEKIISATPRRG
jgi:ferritin-like metal-binding protein YciE